MWGWWMSGRNEEKKKGNEKRRGDQRRPRGLSSSTKDIDLGRQGVEYTYPTQF